MKIIPTHMVYFIYYLVEVTDDAVLISWRGVLLLTTKCSIFWLILYFGTKLLPFSIDVESLELFVGITCLEVEDDDAVHSNPVLVSTPDVSLILSSGVSKSDLHTKRERTMLPSSITFFDWLLIFVCLRSDWLFLIRGILY